MSCSARSARTTVRQLLNGRQVGVRHDGAMARRAVILPWLVALLLPSGAEAQTPSVTVARLAARPSIDGVIGDDEWSGTPRFELSYQTQPGDNSPATESTEVRVGYDRDYLYVAIRAFDGDPAGVRARVTRRDDIFGDDYVTIYLDTYDDRRRAYVFSFNPLGIQGDGLYTEGVATGRDWDDNINRTWDGVLQSKGALTGDGYVIEAAIPFSTLRYAAGQERQWGLHVQRRIARKAEEVSWQPISRTVASLLTQMGSLTGLTDIGGGPAIDVIPALTSAVTGARRGDGTLAHAADHSPGVTVNWAATPNTTVSVAVNPDFSQIEADVPQIEVNQRFALNYPEKRPFFLEGDQFFRSPGALGFLTTRQIVDPDWGVKLTSKAGGNTFAVLAAADAAPGARAPADSPGRGDDAWFGVVRYQRDLLRNSSSGAFVTTRRFAGETNTVASIDGQLRLPLQTIGYQLSKSFTDAGRVSTPGDATYVWYDLVGRNWRLFVNDHRLSAGYRNDAAFVRRTGIQSNTVNFGYEFQGERTWWVRVRPFLVAKAQRTPEGLLDESYVDPGADLTLARGITVYAYHSFHRDAFLGREYDYRFNAVSYTVNAFKRVVASGRLQHGEAVHFDPIRPQVGRNLNASLTVAIKPDARLDSEFLFLTNRLTESGSGRELFDQTVLRNRTNYQFTREHATRSIVEYNSLTRRLSVSLLYTFLPKPNTAVYAGYGDVFLDEIESDPRRATRRFQRQTQTVFVKLSHTIRR
jgi:hypothetical protein